MTMLTSLTIVFAYFAVSSTNSQATGNCRFANKYDVKDIIENNGIREAFINDYFLMEQEFINQPDISLHPHLFTTYDGSQLNFQTGTKRNSRAWTASSKESLHLMYLLHTMNDNQFTDISNEIHILDTKLTAFQRFNIMYPGFGGFLPWFIVEQNASNPNDYFIVPTNDWQHKTPALDNGQMYWSLYAIKWAIIENYDIITSNNPTININTTINLLRNQLDLMEKNAKTIFYNNNGLIRWAAQIKDNQIAPTNINQEYTGNAWSGDPFEGELFLWLLDLKSSWNSDAERNEIWSAALNNLNAVNYTFYNDNEVTVDITVQQGWHFSAHEQWKIFELPYLDIDIIYKLFENVEKVRSINSNYGNNGINQEIPGFYASANGPITDWNEAAYYVDNNGIPSVAYGLSENNANYDVITPYGTMTMWLFNESVSAAWLLNILKGPAMQNIYGSTESIYIDGKAICPMVTWDTKITTYIGAKGGVAYWTKYGLQNEGLYDRFIAVMTNHYQSKFGNDANALKTEYDFAYPKVVIPTQYLNDFENCFKYETDAPTTTITTTTTDTSTTASTELVTPSPTNGETVVTTTLTTIAISASASPLSFVVAVCTVYTFFIIF